MKNIHSEYLRENYFKKSPHTIYFSGYVPFIFLSSENTSWVWLLPNHSKIMNILITWYFTLRLFWHTVAVGVLLNLWSVLWIFSPIQI